MKANLIDDPLAPRVLLGAGRQAGHILNLMEGMGLAWDEVELFDDAYPQLRLGPRERPVCGNLEAGVAYCMRARLPAAVALGSKVAALRYAMYRKLDGAGVSLPNLIHPSAVVAPSARLGRNVIVMPGCVIGPHVTLGSICCLFSGVIIEHDAAIGENVVFGPGSAVSGYVTIGRHAFLGTGSVCAPDVRVGERALVGAGAVVVDDIPAGVIAIGVPARVHREVGPDCDAPTQAALDGSLG